MNTSRDTFGQAIRLREVYAACLCVMLGVAPAYAQQTNSTSVGNFQAQVGNAALAAGADPKKVVINLSNNKSVLQWDRLNVPIGATLQFSQPNAQSVVLNRVVSVDPARIDGVMNSNGQVWILSGSGVLFGANSQVNVQGLLASTRNISNADFMAGNYSFSGGGAGKVSNLGDISVADGGYVLLVGSEVDNQGRIQAQLGQVKLASGKAFVLDLNGDKLLRFDVTEALTGSDGQVSKVTNAGQIVADGGAVQMTARAASGLVAQVVNTGGLLQANSARWVDGQIVLDAGPGGEVTAGGQISAQGLEAGTKGGNVTVVGDAITLPNDSRINASGQAGGGTVLVGGDWQGSGSLQQANRVDMQAGAEIKANATTAGDGGKVVLWSTATDPTTRTTVAGDIEARGAGGGWGGKIETSGGQLDVSGNVAAGAGGHWLLDPTDIVVNNAMSTSIVSSLNSATDVTVQASGGELRVEADVTTTGNGNATLTLDGSNATNVSIQRRIKLTDGMNVVVNSGGDVRFDNLGVTNSGIETDSGDITINANGYLFTTTRLDTDLAALRTSTGSISTTSKFAVLGHGAIDIVDGGRATVLTTGMSSSGEANGLSAGIGVVFYRDGTSSLPGYTANYVDSNSTNSVVTLRSTGQVLINATQGIVTTGNYNEGTSTFTAYDANTAGTGIVNRILYSYDKPSSSFVIAAPEISIPQWGGGYVYEAQAGNLGFVSMTNMSAQVGNYYGNRIGAGLNVFALQKLAGSSGPFTYDGTTQSASSGLVTLASDGAAGYNNMYGVADMTAHFSGVNAGNQSFVIDDIRIGGTTVFTGSILTNKSASIAKANLTVTANSASKTYDGLSWSGGNGVTYSGLASTDTSAVLGGALAWGGSSQGAKSAGTYALTPSGYTSNNYNIAYVGSALSINRAALTVTASSATKTYDGTTTAPGSATVGALAGAGAGEYVASATQSFTDKNAGTGKTVQATGVTIKDGIGNEVTSNYQITYADDQTGVINQAPLTLAADSQTKIFDGTVTSTKTPNIVGLQTGDSVTGSTQLFDASAIGARTLSVASYTVNDGNGGNNYAVTLQTANGAINAAPVTTQTVEETASQSVQIAVASATSSLTQLSTPVTTTTSTSIAQPKATATTTVPTTSAASTTGSTSTTGTTTTNTPVTGQSATTTTTQAANTAASTETASISVSSQPAQTTNLNAANTAATPAQSAAAAGTAATEAKPQVTMVSMTALNVNTPSSVGAQTIAAIQTPTAPEDQRDPVLAAVSSFKPPVVLSATSGRAPAARGQAQQVVVPLVQGVLALETLPPKAASQTVDEQRLSGAGNRSRW